MIKTSEKGTVGWAVIAGLCFIACSGVIFGDYNSVKYMGIVVAGIVLSLHATKMCLNSSVAKEKKSLDEYVRKIGMDPLRKKLGIIKELKNQSGKTEEKLKKIREGLALEIENLSKKNEENRAKAKRIVEDLNLARKASCRPNISGKETQAISDEIAELEQESLKNTLDNEENEKQKKTKEEIVKRMTDQSEQKNDANSSTLAFNEQPAHRRRTGMTSNFVADMEVKRGVKEPSVLVCKLYDSELARNTDLKNLEEDLRPKNRLTYSAMSVKNS